MSENTITTPFDRAFAHNVALRPCGFNPGENFESYVDENGNVKNLLGSSVKMLWFQSYCEQANVRGRVESDDYTILIFESAGTGMVSAKARVFIDDICVATGCASKGFILNQPTTMDSAIQNATGSALSRALGYAGFGSVASYEPSAVNPATPSGIVGGELPFTGPNEPAPAVVQNPPAAAPAGTVNQTNAAGDPQQTSLFAGNNAPVQVSNVQADPLAAAKAVIWPSGLNAGKTFGTVLATSPNDIIWMAEKSKKTGPAKDAAIALLPEAKKLCGK